MNKNIENAMTNEQKTVYYVTKISRISSRKYKLSVLRWCGYGLWLFNFFASSMYSTWPQPFLPAATAIFIATMSYCGYHNSQLHEAKEELAKLNKGKVKTK